MIFTELIVNIAASAILLFFGFLFGKFRERKMQGGKNLDYYEFYPFDLDEKKNLLWLRVDPKDYENPKPGYVPADQKYRFEWEGEENLPTYLLPYDEDLNND